jgi:hypothetical protein
MKTKSFKDFIFRTTGKTFQAYWLEKRRREKELRRIYGKDKHHICVPEETGTINQVHPKQRLIVTFYRCALCLRDLTQKEAERLRKK